MRPTSLGLVVATLVAVASAAAASAPTRLSISGAFHTSSSRAVTGTYEGCGFRTKARTLLYGSAAMRIGQGPAVARVAFLIPHYRGPGRYDARVPAPYGRTAVQVVIARNATTGAASGFYVATSGSVSIVHSKNVGRRGHSGSVVGTVHANLRLQRGSKRLRLDGSWHCRIDPTSNGG
jgi:hypothetical protein